MAIFGRDDPHHHPHGGPGRRDDHHGDHRNLHPHDPGRHQAYQNTAHGRGEMVHFAFKQVSLFHNDKHVHVLMWLDGHPLNAGGHGMGEVSVQMLPGRHQVGLAVYNPDAMFDSRHPRVPESVAEFTLDEHHTGLLGALLGHHERHVVIEYSVSQNLLTKTATANIRAIKKLK